MKDLVNDFRGSVNREDLDVELLGTIWGLAQRSGLLCDVPYKPGTLDDSNSTTSLSLPKNISGEEASDWVKRLDDYLNLLQDRLFSSGLHSLGSAPTDEELDGYLEAYFGEALSKEHRHVAITRLRETQRQSKTKGSLFENFTSRLIDFLRGADQNAPRAEEPELLYQAQSIAFLLDKSTEEIDSVLEGLNGGYIRPKPGGDLLRDGPSVLPTGRNIHALDPYRMPSPSAWSRGQRAAEEIIRQHRETNEGAYPETVAVTLWGLDSIKTRGESIAIVLALVGAVPVKEGTGRIVRYDLKPLDDLRRPRIDVLASLSGIFR